MNTRSRSFVACSLLLASSVALARSRLPPLPSTEDAATHDRLLVPNASRDHSAFRLDTEVFGWSADLKEVAAVVMEVARGPLGKHRGETYMLVYGVDEWIPRHNVITHNITHADLPHNPVPIKEAKDFLWSIEYSYQNMWPHRPRRTQAKGDMSVTPLWAPMPTGEPGICRPWVSMRLTHQHQSRLTPYRPMDLTARCALLRKNDTRTYWASPTLAASMMRFDFAARTHNEESARFLVSSRWSHARMPHIELNAPASVRKGKEVARLAHALSSLAPTKQQWRNQEEKAGNDIDNRWQADIEGGHDWLPLAIGVLGDLGIALGRIRAVDGPLVSPSASQHAPARKTPLASTQVSSPQQTSRLQGALAAARRPRFGHEAGNEADDMPTRLPPSLAGESGMVDGLVTQHDPIEDAFTDEAAPIFKPGHVRVDEAPHRAPVTTGSPTTGKQPVSALSPGQLRIVLRLASRTTASSDEDVPPANSPANDAPAPSKQDMPPADPTPTDAGRFLKGWSP